MDKKTEGRREDILNEMREINRLRQGIVSEQFYGTGNKKRGPYYVLQGYTGGKHWSKRVSRDKIDQVRSDISQSANLKDLCRAFAEVTEQATIKQDCVDSKKNARKQTKHVTRKPKRS